MATFAPSAARRLAIAAPIPREPPVMSATFPSRFLGTVFLLFLYSRFPLLSLFADPVTYVRRTVEERDACCFTAAKESNSLNVDQIQVLQVQRDLRFALPNLLLQLG